MPVRGRLARDAALALGTVGVAAPLGWMAYSALGIPHNVPLPDALNAGRRALRSPRAGALAYYADDVGRGRPVVLLHSVNAAASSMEMRPLFERFRGGRPVYALDLPGFGFSERRDRDYSPVLYAAAIVDFLQDVLGGREPCDLVSLSLTCEFAARAAIGRPDLVRSHVFISPTGFAAGAAAVGERSGAALRALSNPLWAQALFDLIVTRPSIDYFLSRSFVGPVDGALADYSWRTAHQPGARHAPLAFLSGGLMTPLARSRLYDPLDQPVLVLHDRDAYTSFERLPDTVALHARWRSRRIPGTRGLPHFDRPDTTVRAISEFWLELDGATGDDSSISLNSV